MGTTITISDVGLLLAGLEDFIRERGSGLYTIPTYSKSP